MASGTCRKTLEEVKWNGVKVRGQNDGRMGSACAELMKPLSEVHFCVLETLVINLNGNMFLR